MAPQSKPPKERRFSERVRIGAQLFAVRWPHAGRHRVRVRGRQPQLSPDCAPVSHHSERTTLYCLSGAAARYGCFRLRQGSAQHDQQRSVKDEFGALPEYGILASGLHPVAPRRPQPRRTVGLELQAPAPVSSESAVSEGLRDSWKWPGDDGHPAVGARDGRFSEEQ